MRIEANDRGMGSHAVGALVRVAFASAMILLGLLTTVPPARAATVTDRPLLFSFNGSDTTAGAFVRPYAVEIDQANGFVYVIDYEPKVVDKFDLAGKAQPFSATGNSSLAPGFESSDVAVDNSSVNPGRLYLVRSGSGGNNINAFSPAGEALWSISGPWAVAASVDSKGNVWIGDNSSPSQQGAEEPPEIEEYAATGNPPAKLESFRPPYQLNEHGLYPDASGNLYVVDGSTSYLDKYVVIGAGTLTAGSKTITNVSGGGPFSVGEAIFGAGLSVPATYTSQATIAECRPSCAAPTELVLSTAASASGTGVPLRSLTTIDPFFSDAVTVDQSSAAGHVFDVHPYTFGEYDAVGGLIRTTGASLIRSGQGIAYDRALDRVYVADNAAETVDVFGPAITGTVPDLTTEAPSPLGYRTATFNGKVNPQGVPNRYFFEWASIYTGWREPQTSPSQSLPEDTSAHPVSFEATGLKSNTKYVVRLVAENTGDHLRSVSAPVSFTTAKPPVPVVSIQPPSQVTASSAHVAGAIATFEDETSWRVETSTDPKCETGFTGEGLAPGASSQTIPPGQAGSVQVEYDLKGLLPAQRYCVRIEATNGGGSSYSTVEVFETETVPPSEAQTAFVAPRLDTSVRLNARVNPQGVPVRFSFKISSDGGASWHATPVAEDGSDAREQIVVGEEVTGLAPSTTYMYRLATATNTAGAAGGVPGEARSFTTRSEAEIAEVDPPPGSCPNEEVRLNEGFAYLGECRGAELVNNPDKGDQNAYAHELFGDGASPLSSDGERVVWSVEGGAPGAYNGSSVSFLAKRTPDGWRSQSLAPPPERQIGGGSMPYTLEDATPDLSRFLFLVVARDVFTHGPETVVRSDENWNQEVLESPGEDGQHYPNGVEDQMTGDGAHVLVVEPTYQNYVASHPAEQLVDLGSGKREVLSIMPDGTPSSCGLIPPDLSGRHPGGQWHPGYRTSSADASRVYFMSHPNGECGGPKGLYERNQKAKTTTLIDPGSAGGHGPEPIRVSPSGREAYFITDSQLDPADRNSDADIYRWNEAEDRSTCVTCKFNPDVGIKLSGTGGWQNVMVSDDFSHVYFASQRQLVAGQGAHGGLYALDGKTLHFVAPVSRELSAEGTAPSPLLSGDGNVLLFESTGRLTADALAKSCPPLSSSEAEGPCRELYRYDDRDQSLECLSCVHGGTTTFNTGFPAGVAAFTFSTGYQLSRDGSTVAFGTQQALVSQDVNNGPDVYEWRNGVLRLITNGVSAFQEGESGPQVWAVDEHGANILFSVADPGLTGFERDGVSNLYDARIGGGFTVPPGKEECFVGDACQGPLPATPFAAPPGSALLFAANGNVSPPTPGARPKPKPKKCGRGQVRKRVHGKPRCVKQKRSSRPSARRHK
jgi:hypothetical protein